MAQLADNIVRVWPAFDRAGFVATINSQLDALSFGGRNVLIRDTLRKYLPPAFPEAIQILLDARGPEIPDCELTGFDSFTVMSQNDFVAAYGLEHLDLSLRALYELTKRFTAEGAIRAFLQRYPAPTLARLAQWAADPNCHVRRLVSEGTQPRLPLAPRLPAVALGFIRHLVIFKDLYRHLAIYTRLNDPVIPLGLLSMLIQGAVLAYLYPQVVDIQGSVFEGITFSLLMGLFIASSAVIAEAAKQRVTFLRIWFVVESL